MVGLLKEATPNFYNGGVLFNQKILIVCGKIHTELIKLSDSGEQFKTKNPKFFEGFVWTYYMDWRKSRAKSCAHLLYMYKLLNVNLSLQDFIGETFYAGIPIVTEKEINDAIKCYQTNENGEAIKPKDSNFCHEKIGIDGKLHKTGQDGEFMPWSDSGDIYGDGSNVTIENLNKEIKHGQQ